MAKARRRDWALVAEAYPVVVQFRARLRQRLAWRKAARDEGLTVSQWVRLTLDREVERTRALARQKERDAA
jgi:hypothetical protein